MRMAQDASF
jgi:CspA family cold shock protein